MLVFPVARADFSPLQGDCESANWRIPGGLAEGAPDIAPAPAPEPRSHPPVVVWFVLLHGRERGDNLVAGREMTDRVGRARVAGEREGLTAAAAEIDIAPRAAS